MSRALSSRGNNPMHYSNSLVRRTNRRYGRPLRSSPIVRCNQSYSLRDLQLYSSASIGGCVRETDGLVPVMVVIQCVQSFFISCCCKLYINFCLLIN